MEPEQSALFLFGEAMAFTNAAALRAAAEIGLADHLGDDARSVPDLAADTGTDPDRLRRVLRILETRGIVVRAGDADHVRLTDAGAALRRDHPNSARASVLMLTDDMFWRTAHALADTLRGDATPFESTFGHGIADYFDRDPAVASLFYDGMEAVSGAENRLVAAACAVPRGSIVADIGGRYGELLRAVLELDPTATGVLLDTPDEVAKHQLAVPGIVDRAEVVGGDYYESVPPADVYLLKRIVHNCDDDEATRVLANCREALRPGGRVLVIDAIVPADAAAHDSKAMDVMMLAAGTGGERTAAELGPLIEQAGLRVIEVRPTDTPMSIVVTAAA